MTFSAILQFSQGVFTGDPGKTVRRPLPLADFDVESVGDHTGVNNWKFILDDAPAGSALGPFPLVLSDGVATSVTVTPDVPGSYPVRLLLSDGTTTKSQRRVFIVENSRGWAIPPFRMIDTEADYTGNTRGWAEAIEEIFADILANAFGGGAGGGNQVIFRPGGVAAGNVFTTFATALAAAQALEGDVELIFDNSLAATTVPAGTYNLASRIGLLGLGSAPVGVQLAAGAFFQHCPRLANLSITVSGVGATGFTYPTANPTLRVRRCVLTANSHSLITFNGASKLFLSENSSLVAASAAIVTTPAASATTVYLADSSTCAAFTLGGAGDTTVRVLDRQSVARVSQSVSGALDIVPPVVSRVVFDPSGGFDDGYIFDTWEGAMARALALPGLVEIYIPDPGPHNISGLTDLQRRIALVGPEGRASLVLQDASTMVDPTRFERLDITAPAATAPTIYSNGDLRLLMVDSSITGSATATVYQAFAVSSDDKITLIDSELFAGGGEIFDLGVGYNVELELRGRSQVDTGVFKGGGDLTVTVDDPRSVMHPTQDMTGAFTIHAPRVSQLIYDPLGTNDGYTYTTWEGVHARALLLHGNVEIYAPSGTHPIPTGTWDMEHRIFLVGSKYAYPTFEAQSGAVLDNLPGMRFAVLDSVSAADILSYSTTPNLLELEHSTLVGHTSPFYSSGPLELWMRGASLLDQGAGPVFDIAAIDTLLAFLEGSSEIEEDALTGAGAAEVRICSQQAQCSGIQTGLATLNISGANKEKLARYPMVYPFYGVAGTEVVDDAGYQTIGVIDIDPSLSPASSVPDNFTRSFTFKATGEVEAVGTTMSIRLVNESNTEVTGSEITTTVAAESSVEKLSASLSLGAAPDLTNDRRAYRVQIKRNGGVLGDTVTCRSAYIEVKYE